MRKLMMILAALMACVLFLPMKVCAATYVHENTSYQCVIEDDANLLTEEEKEELLEVMKPITSYGNVAFKSIEYNYDTTKNYIKSYYRQVFGKSSGTVFLIDMDNRNIWIFSDDKIYRTITNSYADTITDNVYTYATRGDYSTCAQEAFSQIYRLLEGGRIAQPMKYISNALLAVVLALLGNYIRLRLYTCRKKVDTDQLLKKMNHHVKYTYKDRILLHTKRVYSPPSSDCDGGGDSSGGGSSDSGGGGGHSF